MKVFAILSLLALEAEAFGAPAPDSVADFFPCEGHCKNGGTCTENGNDVKCTCPDTFTGPTCEKAKFFSSSLYINRCMAACSRCQEIKLIPRNVQTYYDCHKKIFEDTERDPSTTWLRFYDKGPYMAKFLEENCPQECELLEDCKDTKNNPGETGADTTVSRCLANRKKTLRAVQWKQEKYNSCEKVKDEGWCSVKYIRSLICCPYSCGTCPGGANIHLKNKKAGEQCETLYECSGLCDVGKGLCYGSLRSVRERNKRNWEQQQQQRKACKEGSKEACKEGERRGGLVESLFGGYDSLLKTQKDAAAERKAAKKDDPWQLIRTAAERKAAADHEAAADRKEKTPPGAAGGAGGAPGAAGGAGGAPGAAGGAGGAPGAASGAGGEQ